MRKPIAALLLYIGLASAALAQTTFTMPPPAGVTVAGVQVVTTCGAASLTNNAVAFLAMNTSGQLCTNATGGGTTTVVGTTSNASSAVATSATNIASVAYNYGFNGTTWDQLQVDASKNLKVLEANSAAILAAVVGPIPTQAGTVSIGGVTELGSSVWAPVAPATATATKSDLIGCQYNSTNLVFINGQQGQVGCDQRGGLYIQDGQAIASVSVTSATTLFTVSDTSGFGAISIQVTSAGSASTITYEASEDGTTWSNALGYPASTQGPSSTTTTVGLNYFPLTSKQFRARVSTYGSGTVTVQATLRKDSFPTRAIAIANTPTIVGTLNEGNSVAGVSLSSVVEARTTNKTAVTSGQFVRPIATTVGATIQKPYQVPELDWTYVAAAGGITNTTTAVTMIVAAGAGIRNYATGCQLSNSTLGAGGEIAIRDGAAGTVIWRGIVATTATDPVNITFPTPLRGTANTLMEFVTLTASVTGALYVNCQGYQAP